MKRGVLVDKRAINEVLPEIPMDFEMDMRNMIAALPYERKEPVVKKKISLSIALAVLLVLIVIGAVAAMLGGKDFTGQVIAPMAQNSSGNKFTRDEVVEILGKLEEAGISLSEENKAEFLHEDGYYKEELMRVVVKTELGFYPSQWSIEDQAWYHQMLVDTGLLDFVGSVLPEEGEIKQDEAVRIALDTIRQVYNETTDVTDSAIYDRHVQYLEMYDSIYNEADHTYTEVKMNERQWLIEYEPKDLYHNYYFVRISPKGKVLETTVTKRLSRDDSHMLWPDEVFDAFQNVFGPMDNWEAETWIAYQAEVKRAYEKVGARTKASTYVVNQTYGIPDAQSISKDAAVTAARKALDGSENDKPIYTIYMIGSKGPIWKVVLKNDAQTRMAEVHAYTGEVLETGIFDREKGNSSFFTTLKETLPVMPVDRSDVNSDTGDKMIDKVDVNAPLVALNAEGKPIFWGSTVVDKAYWDALEATGYNAKNARDMTRKWIDSYGEDMADWPMVANATYWVWHFYDGESESLPGWPLEGFITQEEALSIAYAAIKKAAEGTLSEAQIDALKPMIALWYNDPQKGTDSYFMQLWDVSRSPERMLAYAMIDARTGEVLVVDVDLFGNG